MLLVVGLGNPGREYASHRHNVGFMALDELTSLAGVRSDPLRDKFSGSYAKAEISGKPAALLKPMTYMNESGRSVQPAMAFFKVEPRELLVLHDELDLPFGTVRLKFGGGHAGHNGLRSIMAHVGTGDFGRVRIGIGRPPPGFRGEVADYVLSSFDPIERSQLNDCLKQSAESVLEVATRGFEAAMNARNTRPKQPGKAKPPKPDPIQGKAEEALVPRSEAEPRGRSPRGEP